MMRIGSIYSINYINWKHNPKAYAFIMYDGAGNMTHLLNLGARELSIVDRGKLIYLIKKLSEVPGSSKYTGLTLYRIFQRYALPQIKKCYRTFLKQFIHSYSLINFGLNKQEEFKDYELQYQNKQLYDAAKSDLIVKLMNLYTHRGFNAKKIINSFAAPPKPTVAPSTTKPAPIGKRPAVGTQPAIGIPKEAAPKLATTNVPTTKIKQGAPEAAPETPTTEKHIVGYGSGIGGKAGKEGGTSEKIKDLDKHNDIKIEGYD